MTVRAAILLALIATAARALPPPTPCPGCWVPAPFTSWQIQFTGTLDQSLNATLYEVDLFDTPPAPVTALHAAGPRVACYLDAGTSDPLGPYFDWAVNEQCYRYQECDLLLPFGQAGKAVLEIEYGGSTAKFCAAAYASGFSAARKRRSLDAYRFPCNAGLESPPSPCALFPSDNVWNADISSLPRHALSDAYVARI